MADQPWPPPSTPAVTQAPDRSLGHFLTLVYKPLVERRTWSWTAQLLANLPLGIAWFTVFIVGLSITLGLVSSIVLAPVAVALLVLTLSIARGIGEIERRRARALLDIDPLAPPPRRRAEGVWPSIKVAVADGVAWKAVGYGMVLIFWGSLTFSLGLAAWIAPVAFATSAFGVALPVGLLFLIIAAALLALAPLIVRGLATIDKHLVLALLAEDRTAALERRVDELTVSRDATVDVSAAELRRIERDLHDGAQQRLVALAMDLGLAKARLEAGADPQQATELVGRAHDEAKRAVVELRELVRGIHPAVLTDRGLDAALSALAARSPVPVTIDVQLDRRPSPPVEAAAYFIVAEALTNVAKHSNAGWADVRVRMNNGTLRIAIQDDGVGGAKVVPGGGLAGLADRVASAEGRWRLASPPGGPTSIMVELPCAS
jgi:signal transduction histidine kinase